MNKEFIDFLKFVIEKKKEYKPLKLIDLDGQYKDNKNANTI